MKICFGWHNHVVYAPHQSTTRIQKTLNSLILTVTTMHRSHFFIGDTDSEYCSIWYGFFFFTLTAQQTLLHASEAYAYMLTAAHKSTHDQPQGGDATSLDSIAPGGYAP